MGGVGTGFFINSPRRSLALSVVPMLPHRPGREYLALLAGLGDTQHGSQPEPLAICERHRPGRSVPGATLHRPVLSFITAAAQPPVVVPVSDKPARLEGGLRPTRPYRIKGYRYREF